MLETETEMRRKLGIIKASSSVPDSLISELEDCIPEIFSDDYPQVLSNGALSYEGIDINDQTAEICGISNWSHAALLPFGMELEVFFQTLGYEDLDGWDDVPYRNELYTTFWSKFWSAAKIREGTFHRNAIRDKAETAAKLAILVKNCLEEENGGLWEAGARYQAKLIEAWFQE